MKIRASAFLALVAIVCSLCAASTWAEVEKVDIPGITNFSKIDGMSGFAGPLAGFGGATEPSAMPALKSAGFTTVINLRLADEEGVDLEGSRTAAEAVGLRYTHLPFDAENPAPAVVEEFLAAVGDAANQPVYIHCNSATRAAALWMIGRVLEDGLDIDEASAETKMIAKKPPEAIAFATLYIKQQVKEATSLRR